MENDHADQARNDARDPPRVQLFLAGHRHHETVNSGVVAFRIEASPPGI